MANKPTKKIKLNNVKLAFADSLTQMYEGKYSATVLLELDDPQLKILDDAFKELCKETWGKDAATNFKIIKSQDNLPLHDGDLKPKWGGFPGRMFLKASSKTLPMLFDNVKDPATGLAKRITFDSGRIRGGDFVNLSIVLQSYDHPKNGIRINAFVNGVQFHEQGEPFGEGGGTDGSEFDAADSTAAADFDDDIAF